MASSGIAGSRDGFARAFGSALRDFLEDRGVTQVYVATQLGLRDKKTGNPSKSRLNSYLSNSPPIPNAEVLYLACTKLDGFRFEYNGYRISAEMLGARIAAEEKKPVDQIALRFNRQFNLTNKKGIVTETGTVAVTVKRPPGKIEFSVSLTANEST